MENKENPLLSESEIIKKMKETLDTDDLWSLENAREELIKLKLKRNDSKEYFKKIELMILAKQKKIKKEKEEKAKRDYINYKKSNAFKKSRLIFVAILLGSIYIFKKVGIYIDILLIVIILLSVLNMFRSYRLLKK